MNPAFVEILRCPKTRQRLNYSEGKLTTVDGSITYPVVDDDIVVFNVENEGDKSLVLEFYESHGWARDSDGTLNDTKHFLDVSVPARDYTRQCNRDLKRYLSGQGRFLLDAGCGAIPHDEYLEFHEGFEYRVCLDFSLAAIREAKKRVGAKGLFVVGDLAALPFDDGAFDAAIALHSIYHLPKEQQPSAFQELGRILNESASAVVVYSWAKAPLAAAIRILLRITKRSAPENFEKPIPLPFFPQSRSWFDSQNWTFHYRIRAFRPVSGDVLKLHVHDNPTGRIVTKCFLNLQRFFPGFFGRYGRHPAIVIHRKPE